jgi:hypothetical protein
VSDEDSIGAATEVAPKVDAILLDSSNLTLAIQELGDTGRVHYWTFSEDSRANRHKPVFLAESLKADNGCTGFEASTAVRHRRSQRRTHWTMDSTIGDSSPASIKPPANHLRVAGSIPGAHTLIAPCSFASQIIL